MNKTFTESRKKVSRRNAIASEAHAETSNRYKCERVFKRKYNTKKMIAGLITRISTEKFVPITIISVIFIVVVYIVHSCRASTVASTVNIPAIS